MRRGPKPAKSKEANPPATPKSPKDDGARVRDLEKRLAEALEREAGALTREVEALGKLQTRDRDLTEALEQQTATAEVLKLIASTPGDLQPTFDGIVQRARQLCDGLFSILYGLHGELVTIEADDHITPENRQLLRSRFPMAVNQNAIVRRVFLEHRVVHVEDAAADPHFQRIPLQQAVGYRTLLLVPMLREGAVIGAIGVGRVEPGGFTERQVALLQTFADQAVIAIENVRLFNETKEALEQQTATSGILRVIASSPTDVQPVFDTIAERAMQLCDADQGWVFSFDGELIHASSRANASEEGIDAVRQAFPVAPSRGTVTGRAILTGDVVHIPDVREDPEYALKALAETASYRGLLGVPMLHRGRPIGVISVARTAAGPFSDTQIALLRTFADQAVIAIENVRLFKELQTSNSDLTTALDKQTATSEILRVISSSPTDVQPVFDTIADSVMRLCDAWSVAVYPFDGELVHVTAARGGLPDSANFLKERFPMRPTSDAPDMVVRAIVERTIVHVPDSELVNRPGPREIGRARGFRAAIVVPMLRGGEPIGAIGVSRDEPGAFSPAQIEMLQTFADQAVIAIENARLFSELQEKNRALTQAHAQVSEALDQQTATSEILRVISRSQTDVQPVFDTILRSAIRLCDGLFGALYRFDGELMHQVAQHNYGPDALAEARRAFPARPSRALSGGRAILDRAVVNLPDIQLDSEYQQAIARAAGARSILAVPMLREGSVTGAIAVARAQPGLFSDNHVELLKTFADQAVIAIENARLLSELQARTSELTRSVEQLTALGEVGRAVGSTLDLETVLTTIVSRAVDLSGLDGGVVSEYDEAAKEFVQRAVAETGGVLTRALRGVRYRKGEGAIGRTAITREPAQVPDITVPGAYDSRVRADLIESGIRAVLAVPMVHQERLIGCLGVMRKRAGEFPAETIELLRTFATQSALAIQNARLFQEIADKSRQLEAASQHKSEFLANMSHELRTPLNAVIGFSEVLRERMFGDVNEKQEEYLNDIHASGQHLLSLINDILDLSKIEAGRMELELTDFDLPTAIDNALTLVRERAGRRSIALHQAAHEGLRQIRGDERKIKQVLLNLLSNAIKFTPDGGRIAVRAVAVDGSVEVSVSDTGVGIAPEDQEAIFEEFRQVGTAAKKVEGTGLGLALSRKFVELHGGRIWVQSQVGVGSTFTFTIPLRS